MGAAESEWVLSTREFHLAWEDADGIDFPLCLTSGDPTHYVDGDDERRTRAALRHAVSTAMTPAKRAAMTAFTRPRFSVAVSGLDASRSHEDGTHYIRMYAAWSEGETGYIARQVGLPNPNLGGDVRISAHPFTSWTRALVELLPDVKPGKRHRDTAVPLTTFAVGDRLVPVVDASADKNSAAAAFVHIMPSTCGNLTAIVGSVTEGRRPEHIELRWHDIPNDGRYLLLIDGDPPSATAMPASSQDLAKMLNRSLNALKQRRQISA